MADTVAIPDTTDHTSLRLMMADHARRAQLADAPGNVDEFVMDLMDRLAAAESEEDLFEIQESGGTISGKDFVDRPFFLRGDNIRWMKSTLESATAYPFYALITVRPMDAPDEEVTLNCGGRTFVTVLWKLETMGGFDRFGEEGRPLMIRSRPAREGAVLFLVPVTAVPVRPASNGKKK